MGDTTERPKPSAVVPSGSRLMVNLKPGGVYLDENLVEHPRSNFDALTFAHTVTCGPPTPLAMDPRVFSADMTQDHR
jgi:hypothetical protein